MLEVLYHRANFGETPILPAACATKNVEFLCVFFCLSVTHVNARVCAQHFAMKALEYRKDFDTIG